MIQLNDIGVEYEGRAVLQNLDTVFETQAFTYIVGPNGAGKSTLLKALAGIIPLSHGKILYDGRALSTMTNIERARLITYLPQVRPIPEMNVLTMIQHGRFPHLGFSKKLSPRDRQAVDEAIAMTDVTGLLHKTVTTLSGGERQRVYLAMAIAQNAAIILFDEPATHLDVRYQLELAHILMTLHEQGKTIISVAQDLPQAFTFANRICVMQQGKIISHDTPQAVQQSGCLPIIFGLSLQPVPSDSNMLYRYYFPGQDRSQEV